MEIKKRKTPDHWSHVRQRRQTLQRRVRRRGPRRGVATGQQLFTLASVPLKACRVPSAVSPHRRGFFPSAAVQVFVLERSRGGDDYGPRRGCFRPPSPVVVQCRPALITARGRGPPLSPPADDRSPACLRAASNPGVDGEMELNLVMTGKLKAAFEE